MLALTLQAGEESLISDFFPSLSSLGRVGGSSFSQALNYSEASLTTSSWVFVLSPVVPPLINGVHCSKNAN